MLPVAKKRLIVGVVVVAGVAGAVYWYVTEPVRLARAAMKHVLYDPESAMYDDVRKSDKALRPVCGYVNAKNRMGAYVGRKRFAVLYGVSSNTDGDVVFEGDPSYADFDQAYWKLFCNR